MRPPRLSEVFPPSGDGGTKHDPGCRMKFGRKDPNCARCRELLAGAPTRGWGPSKNDRPAAPHSCERSGCGPVCTAGEW